jgi:hypothetical protein
LTKVTRARELVALLREPALAVRLGWAGFAHLNPWLAPGLGLVADGHFAPLPADFFSFSLPLAASAMLRALLFGAPFIALAVLLSRRRWQSRPRQLTVTVLTLVITLVTVGVTVLGDGLADVPKQGHLAFNAALAWWIGASVVGLRALLAALRRWRAAR